MSQCRGCGYEGIRWAKRENGTTHPPLQPLPDGLLVITESGVVRYTTGYAVHVCDPAEAMRWEELAQERAAEHEIARQVREERQAAYDEERALYLARLGVAMRSTCGRCGAPPGGACVNLNDVRMGRVPRENRNPHWDRMPPVVHSDLPEVEGVDQV